MTIVLMMLACVGTEPLPVEDTGEPVVEDTGPAEDTAAPTCEPRAVACGETVSDALPEATSPGCEPEQASHVYQLEAPASVEAPGVRVAGLDDTCGAPQCTAAGAGGYEWVEGAFMVEGDPGQSYTLTITCD